jgi:hypothetical protein
MGDVINLRRARKAKVRAEAKVEADAARALHGRTLAEKQRDEDAMRRLHRAVDGAFLSADEDGNRPG